MKYEATDADLYNGNPSASGPVGNTEIIMPAGPDPTGQDITPSGPDPAKPALGNVWEQRLRPRKS